MEVVQHEGPDQQRPPAAAPPVLGIRCRAEQYQQQRQEEGRQLLKEPAQSGRTAAAGPRYVAAILSLGTGLVQQVGPASDHQSPAEEGHGGVTALHQPGAAKVEEELNMEGEAPLTPG